MRRPAIVHAESERRAPRRPAARACRSPAGARARSGSTTYLDSPWPRTDAARTPRPRLGGETWMTTCATGKPRDAGTDQAWRNSGTRTDRGLDSRPASNSRPRYHRRGQCRLLPKPHRRAAPTGMHRLFVSPRRQRRAVKRPSMVDALDAWPPRKPPTLASFLDDGRQVVFGSRATTRARDWMRDDANESRRRLIAGCEPIVADLCEPKPKPQAPRSFISTIRRVGAATREKPESSGEATCWPRVGRGRLGQVLRLLKRRPDTSAGPNLSRVSGWHER